MRRRHSLFIIACIILSLLPAAAISQETAATPAAAAATPEKKSKDDELFNSDFSKEPTYIKSETLTVKQKEKIFLYSGQVEVRQGDMTLTSELLEGKYNDQNEIRELVARNNVLIVKGENIRATSNRAVYDKATETLTLMENPQLEQDGTILTADKIKIFLQEDRSTAEGEVRMKLVNKGTEDKGGPNILGISKDKEKEKK